MQNRYAVIMAGGKGERFWPQSRLRRPKHLLPIIGDKPMLAQTIDRLEGLVPEENVLVITNSQQRDAVVETIPSVPRDNIVAEPVGRDTAAAVGLATVLVKQRDPEATFAMLPADHVIRDADSFRRVMRAAFAAAEQGNVLATIGVKPTEPATGYGYIQRGDEIARAEDRAVYRVERFVEKPDLETARKYLAAGDYFWNAGMFVWQVSSIERAFREHAADLHEGLAQIESDLAAGRTLDESLAERYPGLRKISIDYAVMEKASNVVMVESEFDWDDAGSWPALARHFPADSDGNTLLGNTVTEDARGNIVLSGDDHLVATLGVDDLIVIHTPDATLVCRKDRAQDIKKIVERLAGDPAAEGFV